MSAALDDFKDSDGLWVKTFGTGGINQQITKSGAKWDGMRNRCKIGGAQQNKLPTYFGCTMSETFSDFQFFVNWHTAQVGYGFDGYHLDKDILFTNNKLYSEYTCVLVPYALNMFLTASNSARGNWPQGVSFNKQKCKFTAQINISSRKKHLGTYATSEDAHSAYKTAKDSEARRWYERLKSGEFIVDERVIERMRTWTLPE